MAGKHPTLKKQRTSDLRFIQGWLLSNRWHGTKRSPSLNAVVHALILDIDMELRFRDSRRKPVALPCMSVETKGETDER